MQILITGVAGFIGYHLAQRLLVEDHQIYGIDNLNDYYDVTLKQARLEQLLSQKNFEFNCLDISHRPLVTELFKEHSFDYVVHLAAQAGVRYSLENPEAYIDSNLVGFANLLEGCRHNHVSHLVFASSSSVYGFNQKVPFSVADNVDRPVSLYAATKRANELMAYSYSHLYQIPTTGLRFFTVYGPWGRPDMAYFKFVRAITKNKPIDVYNYGKMRRDFTYINDVIEAIVRIIPKSPLNTLNQPPYKIYNLGNNNPVELKEFIEAIETALNIKAIKNFMPMQPGDVLSTYADVDELVNDIGLRPTTTITQGIKEFVAWYQEFYQLIIDG